MSSKPTTLTSSGTRRPASRSAPMAPRATTSLATKTASNVARSSSSSIAACPLGASKSPVAMIARVERQPGLVERLAIALQALLGSGVDERRVGDAGDPRVAERDQMVDRAARAGDVVDVDAGDVDVGQGALEHDREAVADERQELRVVGPRTADHEAVGVLGSQQAGVARVGAVRTRAVRP